MFPPPKYAKISIIDMANNITPIVNKSIVPIIPAIAALKNAKAPISNKIAPNKSVGFKIKAIIEAIFTGIEIPELTGRANKSKNAIRASKINIMALINKNNIVNTKTPNAGNISIKATTTMIMPIISPMIANIRISVSQNDESSVDPPVPVPDWPSDPDDPPLPPELPVLPEPPPDVPPDEPPGDDPPDDPLDPPEPPADVGVPPLPVPPPIEPPGVEGEPPGISPGLGLDGVGSTML